MSTTSADRPPARDASVVLFGRTRRRVLALLLGHPDERLYLRQIVRQSGAGLGAVQRELQVPVERILREPFSVFFMQRAPVAARAGIAPNIRQGAASATAQKIRFIVHSSFGGEGSHMGDGTSRRNLVSVH